MASYSTTESRAHFYRAFETYTMLMSASQVDENSHIKNAEVIRMQSFSRSLMLNILILNRHLVESKAAIERRRSHGIEPRRRSPSRESQHHCPAAP